MPQEQAWIRRRLLADLGLGKKVGRKWERGRITRDSHTGGAGMWGNPAGQIEMGIERKKGSASRRREVMANEGLSTQRFGKTSPKHASCNE